MPTHDTTARVHRFCSDVAFDTETMGKTVYLPVSLARKLAQALNECADDIERVGTFSESGFNTLALALEDIQAD